MHNNCTISPQQREEIMSFFYGHVRRLIRHTDAASLLELAYNDYANVHQREALTREFYGVIVSIFVVFTVQLWCHEQTVGDEKQYRVRRLKETITPLLNKWVGLHIDLNFKVMMAFTVQILAG